MENRAAVCIDLAKYYRIAGIFVGEIFVVFVVEHWTTNILPTNEATLPTFTCSASSNHENKNHELTGYC